MQQDDFSRRSREPQRSSLFHPLRDRLIQEQWQSDREQQWRVQHRSRDLGVLARLPLELRCQIYRTCIPVEYTNSRTTHEQSNLLSLLGTNHRIYDEVKSVLDLHVESRIFNLVLGNKVSFENRYQHIGFLSRGETEHMRPAIIPPLAVFTRTLSRIRNLRLTINVQPVLTEFGFEPATTPFAMWVFKALSRSEALQNLLVDFHLSNEFPADKIINKDGDEMCIGRLIGTLLGLEAVTHCQTVLKQGLCSALQTIRFAIQQESSEHGQLDTFLKSWRWNRETDQQPASQINSEQNPPPPTQISMPKETSVDARELPEYSPPLPDVAELPSLRKVGLIGPQRSPRYSPPPAEEQAASSRIQLLPGHSLSGTIRAASSIPDQPQLSTVVDATPVDDCHSEVRALIPESSEALLSQNPSTSPDHLAVEPKSGTGTPSPSISSDLESPSSTRPNLSQSSKKRQRRRRRLEQKKEIESAVKEQEVEYVVQRLLDTKMVNGIPHLKVKWKGYDERTWEPREQLLEDVPEMVHALDKECKIFPRSKLTGNGIKRSSDSMGDLYGNIPKKQRPSPAMQLVPDNVEDGNLDIDNVAGPRLRAKLRKMHRLFPEETVSICHAALLKMNGHCDEACNYLAEQTSNLGVKSKSGQKKFQDSATSTRQSGQFNEEFTTPQRTQRRAGMSAEPATDKPSPSSDTLTGKKGGPRRPPTALALYIQASRPVIAFELSSKLGHPSLVGESQVTTEGARRWVTLDPGQKTIWERLHAKRVAVYNIQLQAFKAGKPVPSLDEARRLAEARIERATFMDLT